VADRTCPSCGRSGRKVTATTIEALVETARLETLAERDGFHFCASPDCDLAYFASTAGQSVTIPKHALRVRIGVKESLEPRPICYCFGFTAEDIAASAMPSANGARAAEVIQERCRRGLDRCEVENPRGACCLGDVQRMEAEAAKKAASSAAASKGSECCQLTPSDTCAGAKPPVAAGRAVHVVRSANPISDEGTAALVESDEYLGCGLQVELRVTDAVADPMRLTVHCPDIGELVELQRCGGCPESVRLEIDDSQQRIQLCCRKFCIA